MTTVRHTRARPLFATVGALPAVIAGVLCGTLLASDPLALIPADAPIVVAFRDLDHSAERLGAFIRKLDPGFSGLDLDEVQRGFNLPDGVVDTSAPVFLILTRPTIEETAFALAFTPRDTAAFSKEVSGRDNTVRYREGSEGRCCVMMREGVAFAGLKRKPLRLFRRLPREASLAAALDDQQKAIFASSDVFVHIPLAKWRNKIDPLVFLATNMIKLGVAAQQNGRMAEGAASVLDWLADGARTAIDEMESLTLALGFDGETFRLAHYHRFARGGSVADYLSQVKRSGTDMLSLLPDRPFFLIGAFDWQCPPCMSITARFNKHVFSTPSVAPNLTDPMRRRLLDTTLSCYGQMRGSYFMATSPRGKVYPVQVLGGYVTEDADQAIRQLVFLQENAGEAMSSFMGGRFAAKFDRRSEDGVQVFQMDFDFEQMSPFLRRQTIGVYGKNVRLQQVVTGRHNIAYAISQPPTDVHELLDVRRTGKHVGRNPLVRRIVRHLPRNPNAVVVADLGRCLALPPVLVRAILTDAQQASPLDEASGEVSIPPGPMLGWACVVGPTSIRGRWAIDADDLIRTVRLLEDAGKHTWQPMESSSPTARDGSSGPARRAASVR